MLCPVSSTSDSQAVSSSAAQFSPDMAAGETYLFVCSVAAWIKQGTNPTASAADGSIYVPANTFVTIDGGLGAKLSVVRASSDGTASLTRARVL